MENQRKRLWTGFLRKGKMKYLIIQFGIAVLNVIYFFIKLCPIQKNKITFISRQGNDIPIDFQMIIEEFQKEEKEIKTVMLCKELNDGIKNKIQYFFYMFKQMYHIATSKVVILDGYCIPVCILKQKKDLVVIQIWHALGSLKKFGYSTLDLEDGRNGKMAKTMKMHKNYTYILTSSKTSKQFFREAFNAKEEQMKIMNLPRVDFLKSEKAKNKVIKKFHQVYPEANNQKKNILYCPTKRKDIQFRIEDMAKQIPLEKYNFIVKLHDGTEILYVDEQKIEKGKHFIGLELLHVADFIVTDYSAIVFESAITQKPIYFYTFDYETYMHNRGTYINYQEEMPGPICKQWRKVIELIENNDYDKQKEIDFCHKYIENLEENATKQLVNLILDNMK